MGIPYVKCFSLVLIGVKYVSGYFTLKITLFIYLSGNTGRSLTLPPPTVGRFLSRGNLTLGPESGGHRLPASTSDRPVVGGGGCSMALGFLL